MLSHPEELHFVRGYDIVKKIVIFTAIQSEANPMSEQKYIYVLFSATPYRMGRMIRVVTGEPYNHVSIALEEDLKELYTFARRYYRTPFYGGFVTEHPYRYHHNGSTATIRLCRLPVSEEQWQQLRQRIAHMSVHSGRYLYNHLSALLAPLHCKVTVRDAFTCAEFTVSVLQELGYDFSSRKFYTIGDIDEKLADFRFYDGDFPVPPEEDKLFFAPRPVSETLYCSTRDILRLIWRKAST